MAEPARTKTRAKDDKGVWSLTIGPLEPGFYTYGYAIDGGLRMPDPSNPNLELRRWGPTSSFIVPAPQPAVFEEELLTGVQPLVESKYRVLADRNHRAIGGLSMAAGQSMAIGLHNLDRFAYIAAFSGGGNRDEWEKMDAAVLNRKLKVLWIGCGTEDPGYKGVKGMADMLTGKKVNVIWNQSGGGHSWPNWQVYLSKYAPLLFRD